MSQGSTLLERLADDLILDIVDYLKQDDEDFYLSPKSTSPFNQDIRNLSLTNKRLQSILLPSIYHSISITKASSVVGLLRHVLDNPADGGFVKRLTLLQHGDVMEWKKRGLFNNTSGHGAIPGPITTREQIFTEAGSRAGHLPSAILQGHLWAKLLNFLLQFPNLNGLCIDSRLLFYDSHNNTDLIDVVTSQQIFKGLKSVIVGVPRSILTFDVATLAPFFLVPSVRQIRAYNAIRRGDPNWLLEHESTTLASLHKMSNVETIDLRYSRVYLDDLDRLLQLPKALKVFKYRDLCYYGTTAPNSKTTMFHRALNHVSDTLEILTVHWWEEELELPFFWSFRHFNSLKYLTITFTLMVGLNPNAAPSLVDLLPPMLEILVMIYEGTPGYEWMDEDIVDCIRKLLRQKSGSVLNRLRSVEFCEHPRLLTPLIQLALEKEVSIGPLFNA
jgi:hypothetical protein